MSCKIQIEVLIDNKPGYFTVQGKSFYLGLRIKNIGNEPSEEFTISKITIVSAEGKNIGDDISRSFFIKKLNPEETKNIEIKKQGSIIYGLATINLQLKMKTEDIKIEFFQKNHLTGENYMIGTNRWLDFLYIKSSSEYAQDISNKRIAWLTWILIGLAIIQLIFIFSN